MAGHNVLHTMGFDAFGLPAEQYAVQTGQHPRVTTEANIATIRAQLRRLGARPRRPRRSVATTDPGYYRWTQWIFLQIFNSWYDDDAGQGPPDRRAGRRAGRRHARAAPGTNPLGRPWAELDEVERRRVVDAHRLAYLSEAPVNWCPGLGTVLANEEVTADGRSERGNFPVFQRNLRQWMMRITAYADRLLDDLDRLDWPESIKLHAAQLDRPLDGRAHRLRQSTAGADRGLHHPAGHPVRRHLHGAGARAPAGRRADRRRPGRTGTDPRWTGGAATPGRGGRGLPRAGRAPSPTLERQAEGREKTGVFTGAYATNPVNGARDPGVHRRLRADGLRHRRDHGGARPGRARLGVRRGLRAADRRAPSQPPEGFDGRGVHRRRAGDQLRQRRDLAGRPGRRRGQGARSSTGWRRTATARRTVTYRLRDWLFSRQRYWGEPFPIVYDENDLPVALPESMLPVRAARGRRLLAEDLRRRTTPTPSRSRRCRAATEWVDGRAGPGRRAEDVPPRDQHDAATGPAPAGTSCATWTRPTTSGWSTRRSSGTGWARRAPGDVGGVDLYVGGVEHAVLHLLYARFWHKVLFDLGHVSSERAVPPAVQPGHTSRRYAYTDERGFYVPPPRSWSATARFFYEGEPVNREYGKMGKSLKNMVTPDEMCDAYGADTFRRVRDVDGPAGRVAAVGDPGGRRLAAASCSGSGATSSTRQTGERRASSTTAPDEDDAARCCTGPSTGSATTWTTLRFNTADRPADRAEQPR